MPILASHTPALLDGHAALWHVLRPSGRQASAFVSAVLATCTHSGVTVSRPQTEHGGSTWRCIWRLRYVRGLVIAAAYGVLRFAGRRLGILVARHCSSVGACSRSDSAVRACSSVSVTSTPGSPAPRRSREHAQIIESCCANAAAGSSRPGPCAGGRVCASALGIVYAVCDGRWSMSCSARRDPSGSSTGSDGPPWTVIRISLPVRPPGRRAGAAPRSSCRYQNSISRRIPGGEGPTTSTRPGRRGWAELRIARP